MGRKNETATCEGTIEQFGIWGPIRTGRGDFEWLSPDEFSISSDGT